jgi:integrase
MSGRRARGDGSVFRDAARGVWVATIELPRDPDTGRRTRRKASAPTKTAARELLDQMRAEKRKAGTVGKRDVTVGQVLADYLAHPPDKWRSPVTVQVYRDLAARITAALGRARLATLRPSDVERFLAAMAKEGYSTSTITRARGLLRAAISRAERDGQVGRNVAALAGMPAGKERQEGRAFTLDEMRKLLAAAKDDPWWHAYCHVAIMCGLRPGELLGLSWANVDLDGGAVRVRQSLKASGLDELKTKQSRRTITLPAAVTAALREHKRAQREERLRLGEAWQEHGLVFPGADGAPCSRSRAEHGFRMLCERAGLGAGWTRYATRHTFCSVLSGGGVDIEAIADAMGHSNSNVTRTVYRHLIEDKISAAASAFDKIKLA